MRITTTEVQKEIDDINNEKPKGPDLDALFGPKCNASQAKHRTYNSRTGKYKGIYFRKDTNKWRARIKYNGREISLGSFNTEIEAA